MNYLSLLKELTSTTVIHDKNKGEEFEARDKRGWMMRILTACK